MPIFKEALSPGSLTASTPPRRSTECTCTTTLQQTGKAHCTDLDTPMPPKYASGHHAHRTTCRHH
eukprot:2842846-Amphidinium_carterae.1